MLQAGYLLSLPLPPDDSNFDDKLDILEINGLSESNDYLLFPNRAPPEELMALLRLINMRGVCAAHGSSSLTCKEGSPTVFLR